MLSDRKQYGDASQFRRQLVATLVGALIAMCTSSGITLFQWFTQTKQKRYEDRVEAISQFVGALANYSSTQARLAYLATKCSYLAGRARRVAAKAKASSPEADSDYQEFLKENSQFELETAEQYQEIAKNNQALSVAYYKVLLAFGDVPPLGLGGFSERYAAWSPLSEEPDAQQLSKKASDFEQMAVGLKAVAESVGSWGNKWTTDANELTRQSLLTK